MIRRITAAMQLNEDIAGLKSDRFEVCHDECAPEYWSVSAYVEAAQVKAALTLLYGNGARILEQSTPIYFDPDGKPEDTARIHAITCCEFHRKGGSP